MRRTLLAIAALCAGALLISQPSRREVVGPTPGGGYLLPTGWQIHAAGRQTAVDTFPMNSAFTPDGATLFVLNAGVKAPSVSVLDTVSEREIQRLPLADAWQGLAVNAAGDRVYVGGGVERCVWELAFEQRALRVLRRIALPAGRPGERVFAGDLVIAPDGQSLVVASLYQDALVRFEIDSGKALAVWPTGQRPHRLRYAPDGKRLLVSSWGDNRVVEHSAESGAVLDRIDPGPHPAELLFDTRGRLYVAAANTNTVAVFSREGERWKRSETLNVALTPQQPPGSTPGALALDARRGRLYIVCADINAVAVAELGGERSRVTGFIPTGWYPTAATVLADGRLVVLSGRGTRSYANARPVEPGKPPAFDYVGRIQTGTAGFVDAPNDGSLRRHTSTVLANSPYRDRLLSDAGVPRGNPVFPGPGKRSPIEHILYIIKENRTYDQVLGDIGKGDSEPSLTLFGEQITPNQHKLAREFVLLDNFYVNADVSADGHNWSVAAIAPHFVQKVWPNGYGGRGAVHRYRWGQEVAAMPPAGYIWQTAHKAGLKVRSYGYLGVNRRTTAPDGTEVEDVLDPVLKPNANLRYRDYDLGYPDVDRAKEFLRELAEFETAGRWPNFMIMRLGNNHTEGATGGRKTPRAHVADNDAALGMIVEGITRSRFWPKTAIFVLEDDAQNGPDHVDSHRSPAFIISPYVRRGTVDSTMYNTTSMLRTMELMMGLQPLTVFDAAARPMFAAFTNQPDTRPFSAEAARVPLDERNPVNTALARRSARLDFTHADEIDDDELNDILWRLMKGGEPPAPVRSVFGR